jgi:asparagine synthase (glutamine-hydrolysing)
MSGFVAVFQLNGAPPDHAWLCTATDYLAFRGPDARDAWCDGAIGMGHALLRATFESVDERQPFSLDDHVWAVADARVDGRAELLSQLRSSGREVASEASDAELILHAYHAWGEACVDRLIGDFAFAIWDGRARRLFCARDQFGATPFYYAQAGGALLVSNTLNALRLHPGVPDTLDEETISEYLLFGLYPASEGTTFSAIRRLRPAHTLTAHGGRVQIRRYWSAPESVELVRYKRPEEYVERFRALFDQAVGDRLRTGAVAAHLSGGMDSASIAATAHRLLKTAGRPFDLRGYTMVFRRLIPDDEGDFAQQVADHCGFPVELLAIDDYFLREPIAPPSFVTPEPWGLPGQITQQEIVERAAAFSRVLLMGFGGDPLFAPRRRSFGERWKEGDRRGALRGLAGPAYRRLRRLRRGLAGSHGALQPIMPDWFDPAFAVRTQVRARWRARMKSLSGPDQQRTMAGAALWETIFIGSDPAFTAVPVKTRWPFFDLRLLNYMLSVPPVPWCRAKDLLRQAMRDTLPETVRLRPKTPLRGFPGHVALQQQGVPAWMRDLASAPEIAPYVDRRRLSRLLESVPTPGALMQVTGVLSVAWWLRYQRRPDAGLRDREHEHDRIRHATI